MKNLSPRFAVLVLAAIFTGLAAGGFWWFSPGDNRGLPAVSSRQVGAKPTGESASSGGTAPVPTPAATVVKPVLTAQNPKAVTFASFQSRPFAVTKANGAFGWTAEDGRSPEAIRQLAHNELEAERMTAENASIKRRQLVYCAEPIAVTVQRARAEGKTVQSFTLPALDGQAYDVEVTQNSVEPVIAAGSLVGHLKDRPNSLASIGFKDGYESFNIISPDDGLYLVADAREAGQVMVKEIIPGVYGAPAKLSREPDYILTK